MITKLEQLLQQAKAGPPATVAVAQAADKAVLEAVVAAKADGIADCILVGDRVQIAAILAEIDQDATQYTIVHTAEHGDCAALAVELVRSGKAQFLMKGLLSTGELLRAVVDREKGLRTGKTLSHTMFYEVPTYHKLLCLTDGGMNTFPDLDKKADILENAIETCKKLGIASPICACVCGAEAVDPKVQSTLDAQALCQMTGRFGAEVYGPCGLDLAISREACEHKGYAPKGGGNADILLVPTYEVGNGIGKAMTYFGAAQSAGIIVGAKVPIVLVSRSDTAQTKLYSIALAKIAAQE